MKTQFRIDRYASAVAAALVLAAAPVGAAPLIPFGGFETGLNGWTIANQVGGAGSFAIQSGTTSPVNGDPMPAPPQGSNAVVSDSAEPGTHVLYQDFFVPLDNGTSTLSFFLFIGNRADRFATPDSLDFSGAAINQQARVDILRGGTDPFSLAGADVLVNLFRTNVGSPLVTGYNPFTIDVTALLFANRGQTLRLRFAEVDNLAQFQLGVDAVNLDAVSAPEPTSMLLLGTGLAGLAARTRRRRQSRDVLRTSMRHATRAAVIPGLLAGLIAAQPAPAGADTIPVTILDANLQVTTVLSAGLAQPIGIVFLGSTNDYLVLEKASGQIKRVVNGVIQATPVLDLAVNSNSERGLLSMVLHPSFPDVPYAYIRWTESSTGADSTVVANVPLLGNRVDRYTWNGSTLTFDRNLLRLLARQTGNVSIPGHEGIVNANEGGNHNGGVIDFGPDGKLYVFSGDAGRRGWMQNLANGPFLTAPFVDDNVGGPESDNAHVTGVIFRINEDGSTPSDNPFFAVGAAIGGEAGANVQKIVSYGHRNGFGMAFDPIGGSLWVTENGDDAFSELNRIVPGMNGGWVQFAGPVSRIKEFKFIETTQFGLALQQVRYPPTRVAYTSAAALARLFMLPGATYVDPALSWKYEVGPAGAQFVHNGALGAEYEGTFWMGSARSFQQVGGTGGSLYRIKLTADRLAVDTSADPRLADKVADNLFRAQKFDGTESESLIIGTGFGTTTDIVQGPDGNLYIVNLTDNTIYKISRKP